MRGCAGAQEGEFFAQRPSIAMRSNYRDLDAYRLAAAVGDEVFAATSRWPSYVRWSIGLQLVRAADSVGANIAEAAGRWHRQDQRRFLLIARGSLYETEHWIARAAARGLVNPEDWDGRLARTAAALSALTKNWPRS